MAVDITITGLTVAQQQEVRDAFVAIQGPIPTAGDPPVPTMTAAQFVKLCIFRYMKAAVKGHKRATHETTLATEQAAVESDYGDTVA